MFVNRSIVGFFLRLVLAYGLLIAAWPIVNNLYASFYRVVGNAVFGSFGQDGRVRLLPRPEPDSEMDTDVEFSIDGTTYRGTSFLSSQLMGYIPTVMVIALIIATPLPMLRRLKALLLGWVLANFLLMFRLGIFFLYLFSRDHQQAMFAPGPIVRAIIDGSFTVFTRSLGFAFTAPIAIWILVSFRKSDLDRLRSKFLGHSDCTSRPNP